MNIEQLRETIEEAVQPDYRGRLLSRGQARAMIWRNGELPEGSPRFTENLSYDLASYGLSLLSMAIRLRDQGDEEVLVPVALERAGDALEAVVSKGNPDDTARGFYRLLAAAAFHLGGFSARAFSLLAQSLNDSNLSDMERMFALLIVRSLRDLEDGITDFHEDGQGSDADLLAKYLTGVDDELEAQEQTSGEIEAAISDVLEECFCSGLGIFLVALERGDSELVSDAIAELDKGLQTAAELNFVLQWWCFRVASEVVTDLWDSSFHEVVPPVLPDADNERWSRLRALYISSLYKRERAEVDLWPSQIDAAIRSIDTSDNLVVSLPTSAGKTRVAELCILRCLADGKRVVFVTPLRALSAQTEVGLQKTFGPLGISITALYGSIGTSNFEADTLKERQIVVATPEKLDFALRSDPGILDDVGLVVLDEGHMIGLGEREIRYEVQIQRLLSRADSNLRRIVCLSAILPDGDQFEDFVAWLRKDSPGDAISINWRPTRIRFGEVSWSNGRARLSLHVGDENPFVPNFFGSRPPLRGQRTVPFPRDQRELVLATAWRLVEDGQSVLVYCPQKRSVEPFAGVIVDLVERGFLDPVLAVDENEIAAALSIGAEWLGEDHSVLKCLRLGVAVHHGSLPSPFRKEVESLLRKGAIKIIISSPTLAQGLNLSATAVVMHSLYRIGEVIPASEFKNVIGRAGRAFIDVEGLVLFPVFQAKRRKLQHWQQLINSVSDQQLESGLLRLVVELLKRMNDALGTPDIVELQEYVLNNANAWAFPAIENEDQENAESAEQSWDKHLTILDTALLSLLGERELEIEEIAGALDDVLNSSLWQRRLNRHADEYREVFSACIASRARSIWGQSTANQRKGYYLAGVGFTTGQQLDAISRDANQFLLQANGAILNDEQNDAIEAFISLAELLFVIPPFVPDNLPENWQDILRIWLLGQPLSEVDTDNHSAVLKFVEEGLVYKLPWGIEAIRVRAQANEDNFGGEDENLTIDDIEVGLAAPTLEAGTLIRSAALLIQAGFSSRAAAIRAVNLTEATFTNGAELRTWLNSGDLQVRFQNEDWPTPESRGLWVEFIRSQVPPEKVIWDRQQINFGIEWHDVDSPPDAGDIVKLRVTGDGVVQVLSKKFEIMGELVDRFIVAPKGIFIVTVGADADSVVGEYRGPSDIDVAEA